MAFAVIGLSIAVFGINYSQNNVNECICNQTEICTCFESCDCSSCKS